MVASSVFLESRDACKAHGPASAPICEKLMALAKIDYAALSDLPLVGLIVARDSEAVRLDTQRNN